MKTVRIPFVRIRFVRLRDIDWNNVHFCREDKVRYRKHLTLGVVVATVCGVIGTTYGITWLIHASTFVNSATAAIWIWE